MRSVSLLRFVNRIKKRPCERNVEKAALRFEDGIFESVSTFVKRSKLEVSPFLYLSGGYVILKSIHAPKSNLHHSRTMNGIRSKTLLLQNQKIQNERSVKHTKPFFRKREICSCARLDLFAIDL